MAFGRNKELMTMNDGLKKIGEGEGQRARIHTHTTKIRFFSE